MSQGYTYNAIAEHPIIPEFDDNEIKYKWNGALLNLSDLPVSDYTKTIYNIAGSITSDTKVVTNILSVSFSKTGDTYEAVVNAQYPPEGEILVGLTLDGVSNPIVITIPAGSNKGSADTGIPSSSSTPVVTESTVTPAKDATYTYQVAVDKPISDKFKVYYGQFYEEDLEDMTSLVPGMNTDMVDTVGTNMVFSIPPVDFNWNDYPERVPDFKYGLVIGLPKSVYQANEYFLSEQSTPGVKEEGFIFRENIVVDGTEYAMLAKTDEGTVFLPNDTESGGGDLEYIFNIKYIK